jgi:hypothetical protein
VSGIKSATNVPDVGSVAIAVASPALQTFRLARPFVRSPFETLTAAVLLLSALGLWMLVIPIELLGFVS